MKCPICLGKGYATDEDIKEYPHRCPNCNGKGFYSVDWQKVRCEVCNGSGKKPMNNEEWFCGLSTEQKAEWLAEEKDDNLCFICKAHCNPDNGCPMSARDIWYAWLKQPHHNEVEK